MMVGVTTVMPAPCILHTVTVLPLLLLMQLVSRAASEGYQYDTADRKEFRAVEATVTYPPSENLTCHQCYYSIEDESGGENCRQSMEPRLFRVQQCAYNQKYCKVQRLVTNGKMVTFSRECAEECTTRCESRGESIGYVMEYCYSCCEHEMCNVMDVVPGSSSAHHVVTSSIWVMTWTFVLFSWLRSSYT